MQEIEKVGHTIVVSWPLQVAPSRFDVMFLGAWECTDEVLKMCNVESKTTESIR